MLSDNVIDVESIRITFRLCKYSVVHSGTLHSQGGTQMGSLRGGGLGRSTWVAPTRAAGSKSRAP